MSEAEGAISAPELAMRWLQVVERPLVIVNAQLRVVWANPAFDALIEAQNLLNLVEGFLSATTASAHEKLQGLIRAGESDSIALLEESDGDGHLLIRASRIPAAAAAAADEDAFGLRIFRTAEDVGLNHLQLAAVFGLTPGETRVLASMLGGLTADDIGRELAISVETVRSHIRRIYDKIGVSSREGLFSRLRQFGF
jgi:DNA-binding CsgD family transcriptional regulator